MVSPSLISIPNLLERLPLMIVHSQKDVDESLGILAERTQSIFQLLLILCLPYQFWNTAMQRKLITGSVGEFHFPHQLNPCQIPVTRS